MAVLKTYLLLLLLCIGADVFAVGGPVKDTAAVNKLNKLAAARFSSDPDTTFYYASQAINIARKINYETGVADGLVQAGHVDYVRGKSEAAVKCFDEAIAIYKKIRDNSGLAACYLQYGRMYNILADYSQALKYLNMALAINKQANDEYALTDSYKNIGIIYFSQGKLSEALDYYYKGLFIAVKNHYREFSADLYNDIGVILQNMEVYPNALEYYKKSLAIYEGTNHLQVLGILNENIGEVLVAQHNYEKAIVYLNKANNIAKKQSDQDGLSSVYTDLGLCYAYKKEYPKALSYLDTSLRIAEKYKIVYNQAYAIIGFATVYNMQKDYRAAYPYSVKGQQIGARLGNLSIRVNAALELNKTLAGLGRINDAYKALNEYLDLKTKLKDNESIQKLTSYNFELSFAVKQRLLAEQQHEKDLLYKQNSRAQRLTIMIFLVVIMAMVVITGIYYNEKRKQQRVSAVLAHKNSEILQQKADMDTQAAKLNDLNTLKDRLIAILAHDLRAPLSTLRGLFGLLQDDSISHEEMLSMIPDVLKKLDYTSDFLDTLLFWINSQMENFDRAAKCFPVKEIVARETEHYYEQAQGKGITLIDSVPQELNACADPDSVRIVVRNLITNAIKFSRDKDVIEVSAKRDGENILISIKDTGEGMTAEQSKKLFKSKVNSKTGTHNESGTGMGLLFCKDLIEKSNGTIWVTSKPGKGSNFFFTLPSADKVNMAASENPVQAVAS
ncbi:sensor histidine kinase [Mucilaginibacter ginsenosidivorans]|uniref:histidine kinase n=1 Tax=Mucilaginibacter ginsenosidivorans TaxID=398053 RepID=A0A5B8V0Y6_9SPHI|nr:sensor histidine kinase [Mucilaginibacter ginsenosidivorans]